MGKKVAILVGLPGTGKTSAGKFFTGKRIPVVRMGKLTQKYLKKNKLTQTEANEKAVRLELRIKFGFDVYAREVVPEVNKLLVNNNLVVIDGMRSPEEWEYFKKNLKNSEIIYLETDIKTRIARLKNRLNRSLTLSEIKIRESYEVKKLKIKSLKKDAAVVIKNNSDQKSFYKNLEKAIQNITCLNFK